MTEFKTVYRVASGKFYVGKTGKDGKVSGVMVRDGRLFGRYREGMFGETIARFTDPVPRDTKDTLRNRAITLEGNPTSKLSFGQLLDMIERSTADKSDA
jgi:hypothetical protein